MIQIGYIVPDIYAGIDNFARELNLGGWVVAENLAFTELSYRGQPSKARASAAMAYSGEMMYEVIQQHDEEPSAFTEVIQSRGYGFHHVAIAVSSLDVAIADYRRRGYDLVTTMAVVGGRGAYMDSRRTLASMLELLEIGEVITHMFKTAHDFARNLGPDGPLVKRL